ncbi:MAG: cytochrome c biogenesis protein CcsA [Chitinophagales bacterium]
MNWYQVTWWKWLCVVLLFYVIGGSWLVPLAPGISKIEPLTFSADSAYTFKITGYNTHFAQADAGKTQVWFKNGNRYFAAQKVSLHATHELTATFGISSLQADSLQTNFDLVINNDYDGTFALRDGITLLPVKAVDSSAFPLAYSAEVEVVHNKHQFLAFPYREILYESIRNTFFHVPMWFVMTALVFFSLVTSIFYLATGKLKYDIYSSQAIVASLLFGTCGLLTGMMWANYTWGRPWVNDPKLNGAAIGVLIYFAYIVLRGSITDDVKRARISAAYNIFALVVFLLFIYIMPRLTDSLHPGNGGNPAFSKYDLDSSMRLFFYPACIGWILLGFWILSILIRLQLIQQKQEQ